MTRFPMPWYITALRIILVLAVYIVFMVSLASYKAETDSVAPGVMLLLQSVTFTLDLSFLFSFGWTHKHKLESLDDSPYRNYKFVLVMRSVWDVVLITGTFVFLNKYYFYSAVAICSLGFEVVLCELQHRHFFKQTKTFTKLLISDIEQTVKLDNCVSTPISTEFRDYDISEEKLWQGVPIASRDTTIKPSCGIMKKKDETGWIIFVLWSSYNTVTNRIKEDLEIIRDLVKRNRNLHMELLRQNDHIFQMRSKIYGPNPNCGDINEVPICPPPVEAWNAEKADGLFVYSNGNIQVFVKVTDFQELAVHAALVRKSIRSLNVERKQLKEGLERRKPLIDELIIEMLKYINEEESKRTSDVRVQIED